MGMANFNKNLFVGVGGVEAINLSHFIGAVHGMEKMMGRADNPLRRILNNASERFLQDKLPLFYLLTVMGKDSKGELAMKGLYFGDDIECYKVACEHSLRENFTMLQVPLKKVVVHLDADEFHSTWLGNKSIYRTRMAIADGGELIVLAPGVKRFGEDDGCDVLIRKCVGGGEGGAGGGRARGAGVTRGKEVHTRGLSGGDPPNPRGKSEMSGGSA
jgi:nickel-dependent lactate racemase